MVFVDTGAWFAWFVPGDPSHSAVRERVEQMVEPLVTTDYCIDETLTLLVARKRPQLALEAGRAFFNEEIACLHFMMPDQIHRAWILFQSKGLLGWSFTDCASKIVIDDLDIRTALALDNHFRAFGNVVVVP